MHYLIRNTETGKYVARMGLEHSYTARHDELRIYPSHEAAEADRCPGNEWSSRSFVLRSWQGPDMPRTECDDIADNMPLPAKCLTFDEAIEIVREAMPDETVTVISNVAYSFMQRSKMYSPKQEG